MNEQRQLRPRTTRVNARDLNGQIAAATDAAILFAGPGAQRQGGLVEVVRDFNQFIDDFLGEYRQHFEALVPELGDLFLDDDELAEWKAIKGKSVGERVEWLKARVESKMPPPWYFVVSWFRLWQQGEFTLTPPDAYWLGIVDEVVGATDLPCPRLLVESQLSPPARDRGSG